MRVITFRAHAVASLCVCVSAYICICGCLTAEGCVLSIKINGEKKFDALQLNVGQGAQRGRMGGWAVPLSPSWNVLPTLISPTLDAFRRCHHPAMFCFAWTQYSRIYTCIMCYVKEYWMSTARISSQEAPANWLAFLACTVHTDWITWGHWFDESCIWAKNTQKLNFSWIFRIWGSHNFSAKVFFFWAVSASHSYTYKQPL